MTVKAYSILEHVGLKQSNSGERGQPFKRQTSQQKAEQTDPKEVTELRMESKLANQN